MLKWTASAFAMAAAMQFGIASAQNTATPPEPSAPDSATDIAEQVPQLEEESRETVRDSRENLQDAREEFQEESRDLNDNEGIQREARYAPDRSAGGIQIDDRVRAATADLDIDDSTRSRYRWHNGEWWFKTKSGNWKYHRDSRWQDFDPTTYRAINARGSMAPGAMQGSGNWVPQGNTDYVQPHQFNSSNGYRPQQYQTYRPNYDRNYGAWNNGSGWNGNGWNNGYNQQFNNGYGYNNGFGQGYNPGNDRYYGYGPNGQPSSISGDRYRGGVIGSQIGGQVGGRTGAIIGGAIGADAAD